MHDPATTCCPDRQTWSGFYAGEAPPEALAALAAHLDGCASCRSVLHEIAGATADATDPLLAALRDSSRHAEEYEGEPACRAAVARVEALVCGASGADAVPECLGEYRIVRLIGRGGMGAVYRAVHRRLGREVALKVIAPGRARAGAAERFRREAAAHGRLDHPNVVRATDAGEAAGVAYLAMDLVDGIDLDRLARARGPLPVADACELARRAAAGLQHLAAHGLVHRDVKPSNLMLDRGGEVKLLDFGLAALSHPARLEAALTDQGQVLGTFDYIAPEQTDPARPVDCRADVYGLGCALFFLLTGSPPYSGPARATPRSKILAHVAGPVPDARDSRADVPAALAAVLARMLAKDPADRFPTPADAAEALAPFCAGSDLARLLEAAGLDPLLPNPPAPPAPAVRNPRRSKRPLVAAACAVLLLAGGLAAAVKFRLLPHDPKPSDATAATQEQQPAPPPPEHAPEGPPRKPVLSVALLAFEGRDAGAKAVAAQATDLLFAKLSAKPDFYLVDRTDLKKVLDEQALGASGAVQADEAVRVGQLTGARILVTGSVIQADKKLYLVAKVISAETGRVFGASAEGAATDELAALAGKLADAVEETVAKQGEKLAPRPVPVGDRIAELRKKLGGRPRPVVFVRAADGRPGASAAQTEVARVAKELGFAVIDSAGGSVGAADVILAVEGFSEATGKVGGLTSARARVSVKAVDRKAGTVLATDRQAAVALDPSAEAAQASAAQDAAGRLTERLLPRLVPPGAKM